MPNARDHYSKMCSTLPRKVCWTVAHIMLTSRANLADLSRCFHEGGKKESASEKCRVSKMLLA
jgi:hypothetical protein